MQQVAENRGDQTSTAPATTWLRPNTAAVETTDRHRTRLISSIAIAATTTLPTNGAFTPF